jgi:hypothetical protein
MTAQVQNAGLVRVTTALLALNWWIGSGTGSAAPKSANDLASPGPDSRAAATVVQATTNIANDAITLTGTITAASTRVIAEVGAFDAAGTGSPPTGGNMNLYSDFAAINLSTGDSIVYTLRLTFS